jgi:type I restriction enzyme S subunit
MSAVDGWTSYTVDQCCEILDRKRVPVNGEEREKRIGEIPYYGANGLQGYIDDFIFDETLILIAEDGGCFDEFATRPIAYRIRGKSWVNNHAHVLRAKKEFDQDAVFYTLEHKDIQSFIVGGTRSKLNQSALRSITVSLPTYKPEQTKIADILSTVDRAIEQTEALIAKQQRIKTGLMQDLLTRGIDENGNLRSEQTHKFKDSPLGRIPVEWDVKQLGFLCELIKDGTHLPPARVSEGPLLLGVYNIVNGKLTRSPSDTRVSWDFYKQMHENWSIQTDDVLLAIVGATIGKTCLAPSDFEAYTLQRSVALIRGKKGVLNNRFLLQYLKSPLFQSIIQTKTNTTAQAGLYLSKIADFNIPICPIEEQIAITAKLEEIGKLGESYQQTEEKLHSIKTALMQDLLTGKKRVTALLNDMERVT